MQTAIKERTDKLANLSNVFLKVGLLVAEGKTDPKVRITKAKKTLVNSGYKECTDYIQVMDALSSGKDKIFYIEKNKKLDGLVLEIIAEFDAGIVSLADRKNNTGLKTANWDPSKTSFVVIMTRKQIEQSYPRLFEYINIIQSL
ncbi:MAG: hypothetical protein AAB529_01225 [Patescibacteria group bacterium]